MPKIFNAQRLYYFQQVVESGSVRGAAEILNVEPSSVSRAVAMLEQESGLHLLQRKGRGIAPTEIGTRLVAYARQQRELLDHFYEEVDHFKNAKHGHINVGAGEGMLDMYFHPFITDFMRENMHITFSLTVASVEENAAALLDDRIDIALWYSPFNDMRFRVHGSRPASPIRAIVHKSHPLADAKRPLSLSDLLPYAGATLHEHFGLRQYIKAAELSEDILMKNVLTTSSYRVLCHFANAGLGYALCPGSFAIWYNMPDLVALPMSNPLLEKCSIAIVTRAGRHLSPAANALLEHLSTHMQDYASTTGHSAGNQR